MADLLVHVVDMTHVKASEQAQVVDATLAKLGVQAKPHLMAFNKLDLLADHQLSAEELASPPWRGWSGETFDEERSRDESHIDVHPMDDDPHRLIARPDPSRHERGGAWNGMPQHPQDSAP
jgi:hypothetical protein